MPAAFVSADVLAARNPLRAEHLMLRSPHGCPLARPAETATKIAARAR